MTESFDVDVLTSDDETAWQTFLGRAANGTLFHDLRFLAYHPPGRHAFHHLMVRHRAQLEALIPGGLIDTADGRVWRSPVGASIGGPVFADRPGLSRVTTTIAALQQHARACGWSGIEMVLPPSTYAETLGNLVPFALFARGFRERRQWLCPLLDLARTEAGTPAAASLFERRQLQSLRTALARGADALETGVEGLPSFADAFVDTYDRHGTTPTHTLTELETLMRQFPDRMSIVLARQEGEVTAAVLMMQLTRELATTFYICSRAHHRRSSGPLVAIAAALDRLRARGCRWLDLGPSASDATVNDGVLFFKEGLGATGWCRSQWTWLAA